MDIPTCDYRSIIKYYSSLNKEDSEITRSRLDYLYDLYNLCDEDTRIRFIKHMQNILLTRFNMDIILTRDADKIIKKGYDTISESDDPRFLGEILPIILVLEKELIYIKNNGIYNDDGIENWMISYLSKYDKLKLKKEKNDVYDIFNAYATRIKKAKVFASIIKTKIKAITSQVFEKVK